MNGKTKNSLDEGVKEIQTNIVALRTTALGPNEVQQQKIATYIHTIDILNRSYNTNYSSYELMSMELTDSNNMVLEGLISRLPLRKE